MADVQTINSSNQSTATSEKLYMENTLLRVSGALFCHDAKRAGKRTDEIELNRGVEGKHITLHPDPQLGQPGPLAHKIFVALIKKHSDYGRPVPNEVSFTKRELMRLIGRKEWGGSASDQLTRALNEIHHTFIKTQFKAPNGRFAEHSFNIFPEIYFERANCDTDPIERCMITLARPIIQSLQDDHFTCLNHLLMQSLGTIGQALYMRLFFHFANLYDGKHRDRIRFQKRYDDICVEWLGGLTVLKHKSKIVREQLGSHLGELSRAGVIASYTISESKRGDGFILAFRPGAAFFTDYDRFYRHRNQGELQFQFHRDRREIADPLKVAYLFVEKKTGAPLTAVPYVTSKDMQTAKQILGRIDFQDMPQFLDYALGEAEKTNYPVQTLGGIRQYVDGYLQSREHAQRAQAAAAVRQRRDREETQRIDYDRFRRTRAEVLFASLPKAEQAIIEGHARAGAGGSRGFVTQSGSLAAIMFGAAKARITAERHADKIPSFVEWERSNRSL